MKGLGGEEGKDELQFIAVYFCYQIYFSSGIVFQVCAVNSPLKCLHA